MTPISDALDTLILYCFNSWNEIIPRKHFLILHKTGHKLALHSQKVQIEESVIEDNEMGGLNTDLFYLWMITLYGYSRNALNAPHEVTLRCNC